MAPDKYWYVSSGKMHFVRKSLFDYIVGRGERVKICSGPGYGLGVDLEETSWQCGAVCVVAGVSCTGRMRGALNAPWCQWVGRCLSMSVGVSFVERREVYRKAKRRKSVVEVCLSLIRVYSGYDS